jgi:hypothetical protein
MRETVKYANRHRNGRGAAIAYPDEVCGFIRPSVSGAHGQGALKYQLSQSEAVSILSIAAARGPRDGSTEAGAI